MENNVFSIFRPKSRNVLFEAAMQSLKGIENLFRSKTEGKDIPFDISPEKMFTRVFPDDPKSPAIFWIDSDQYIIYYPKDSTPYSHKLEEKCKFVEVLRGSLFDENKRMVLHEGDRLKIHPHENYRPHTIGSECYIKVCISNCHSPWDDICP